MKFHRGATRFVILTGNFAIKFPEISEWRLFLSGLLANMQERTFARTGWPELCPIRLSIPGGWLVVMRRARPMTEKEWAEFDAERWADRDEYTVPCEPKRDSFGWIGTNIVVVDYGN